MSALAAAIAALNADPSAGGNFAASLIADATVPADYHLAMYLPEETRETYSVDAGSLSIYPTLAGMSGMDSTYAPVGAVAAAKLVEETAKITALFHMSEKQQREIHAFIQRMQANGGNPSLGAQQEMINFTQILMAAHWGTAEYLRGQAIFTGAIDWTFNGKSITVDYGVPAANKPANLTGTSAFGGSASKFWASVRAARKVVGLGAEAVMSDVTFYAIIDNPVNAVRVQEVAGETVTANSRLQRYRLTKRVGDALNTSDDALDSVVVTVYTRGGSILTRESLSAEPTMKTVDYVPAGKVAFIGAADRDVYRPGRGTEPDLTNPNALGYYHIAPTTEGAGQPGRWAKVYQPEGEEYSVIAKSAGNELPVIESPGKLFILSSDMPA